MSRQWQILDLTEFDGTITSDRGAISLTKKPEVHKRIPVADLAVVLVGMHVHFSAATLHRLCEADVAVLFCDWRGVPEGGAFSWSDHGRIAARHQAQARLSEPRRKNAWGRIVKAKVLGQAAVLDAAGLPETKTLAALSKEVRSGDPGNIEAQAARIYWQALFDGDKRTPGTRSDDGLNACLDYGYAVLRGFVIKSILSAGLSAPLGLFHHGRGNAFALADDLIEPFRPCIDHVVFQLDTTASPSDRAIKQLLVAAAKQPFSDDGRGIPAVLDDFAQQLGQYIEGQRERLNPPTWRGPIQTKDSTHAG
ncbi:type II CRISPR-associated endonuclease Cas1 [Schaalia sp. ZJ405]|uniref:type II CRISPR-associated endonuclease Cas1 n=1 Tax=Schaalia sp. ZJ405 TaxID=2709403 RepID=UPI0013EA92C8|nr:type II CRISPR-associated endonuclease Cas1 [Schaalia sp. ZJ405]QPK81356.1 type II CRISPR-associated endonuclease Cas1 [Schaalia sp. ZJ405]